MRVQKNIPGRGHSVEGSMTSKIRRKRMRLEAGQSSESSLHEAGEGSRGQNVGHVCGSYLFSNH